MNHRRVHHRENQQVRVRIIEDCGFAPSHAAVLVHCGAGVSRSATLAIMYLMRRERWSAAKAREAVTDRRSLVCINDGFWRALCAMEGPLGVTDR